MTLHSLKWKNEIVERNLTVEIDEWDILYIHMDHMLILALHLVYIVMRVKAG